MHEITFRQIVQLWRSDEIAQFARRPHEARACNPDERAQVHRARIEHCCRRNPEQREIDACCPRNADDGERETRGEYGKVLVGDREAV